MHITKLAPPMNATVPIISIVAYNTYSITESQEQALYNIHQKLADLRKKRDETNRQNATDTTNVVKEKQAKLAQLSKELEDVRIKKEGMGVKCRFLHKEEHCRAFEALGSQESALSKTVKEEELKTSEFMESVQDILDSVNDIDEEIESLERDIQEFNITDTSKGAGHGPEIVYVGQRNMYPFEFSSVGRAAAAELPQWNISVSRDETDAVKELTAFFGEISQQLNRDMRDVGIKATLIRVDIEREWLKDSLFGEVRGLFPAKDQVIAFDSILYI